MPTSPKTQFSTLEIQRQALLDQLAHLQQIRRGSLTEQFLMVKRKDGSRVKRGPYPLLTKKVGANTVSQRLCDPTVCALYRRQIQAMRQFEDVVGQLVRIGEKLSDLAVAETVQKKTRSAAGAKRRSAASGSGDGRASGS
jgi:hypothetical protein